MYPAILVIVTVCQHAASTNLASADSVPQPAAMIGALDCRSPSRTRYARRDAVCHPPVQEEVPEQTVLILQSSPTQVVTGYKCTRRTSSFTDVCAVWGHLKRYGPPQIDTPSPLTIKECHQLVTMGTFIREDGRQIHIPMNTKQTYTITKHGHLYLTSNDVSCEGANINLDGELVQGLVVTASSTIGVERIDVEHSSDGMVDLTTHNAIPSSCQSLKGCIAGTDTYIIPGEHQECPLYAVRIAPMKTVMVTTKDGQDKCLVNTEHKLLFQIGPVEPSPTACGEAFTITTTQYSHLKLVIGTAEEERVHRVASQLPPSSLDLDLEIRASEEYLSYRFETMLVKNLHLLGENLCQLASEAVTQMERSPFSPIAIIRVRGDIVQELQCNPVEVTARLGDARSKLCHPTAFPVWLHNQPTWIETGSHVISDRPSTAMMDCKAIFAPYLITKDDHLLVADPYVRQVQLPLQSLPTFLAPVNQQVVHQGFSQSLLYTSDEVTKFNNLVHFARTRDRVVDALTAKYCEGNADCGDFQPPSGSTTFDVKSLEDTIAHPWTALWSELFTKATQAGSICSLVVAIYVILGTGYKLCRVFDYVRHRQVNPSDAIRLVFSPGTALARAVLDQQAHPGPTAPETLEMTNPHMYPDTFHKNNAYPNLGSVNA